jgi:chromosome segregation ATPase
VKDGLSAKVAELKTVKDELSAKEVDLKTLKDGLSAKEAELKTVKDGLSAKEAELKTVKDGLSAKEAEHITVKAGLSAKVAELKTVNDELIATKMQLSTREGEFREAKEYIIDLSDRFQIVSNTLQQLRQTGLFSAEKRERDITEEKAEEAYPENKRQKFSDQELQIANNLLILNSSSSTDATTEPLDEKLEQNSVPATGRGLKRKLKKKLLEIFSNHLDVKQPESQLKLYIENQITTCEKIFTDGRPFTEIKDTEVTALLYYICYVVCNLHQHRAETNLPLSVSVCQYFANTIYTRIDDRKSLLHTLNRMSDGVINTTEANMYLRAERSVLDTHVEQLKQAGQTLQSQLLQAQTDIGALNLTKQLLLTSEAELKTLKVKSAKQTAILTKTQTVIKTLSQKIPFIPTDIFNEIIAIQQQITDVEPNIATGAGHSPSIYPFNSFAVPSVFSLTASPFLLFHQRTSSSLPTPMTSNVLATQNNP